MEGMKKREKRSGFRRRAIDKEKNVGRRSKGDAVGCRLKRREKRKRNRRDFKKRSKNESKPTTRANRARGVKNRVTWRSEAVEGGRKSSRSEPGLSNSENVYGMVGNKLLKKRWFVKERRDGGNRARI